MGKCVISNFVGLAALLGLGSNALAMPYHVPVYSTPVPVQTAACTYPDGSHPARGTETHCYTPSQFLHAYGIDKLHESGLTGKGQVIILADSFGTPTAQADLDHFSEAFGLPKTTIRFIYPNGPYTNPVETAEQVGWAEETSLDLQWAHAIAPDATIVNIVTSSAETVGLDGLPDLFNGIQTAIQEYPGSIISLSFGTGEPTFTGEDIRNYLQGSFHTILKQAIAADVTVLASSGDSGSTNMDQTQKSLVPYPNASYPASEPLITAVGGTALEADWTWTPDGTADDFWNCVISKASPCPTDFLRYKDTPGSRTETVWKEDWNVAAGGGGVSTIFNAGDYQNGVGTDARKLMNGHRAVPDVSLNAAINGGVDIYTSFAAPVANIKGAQWMSTGGTSCSSPEMAGLVALAGQKASEDLGRRTGIGFLNPILYSLSARDFNDIVTESPSSQVPIDNQGLYFSPELLKALGPSRVPPALVAGYYTTPGYDLATGLGTPKAESFVLDVARARISRKNPVIP